MKFTDLLGCKSNKAVAVIPTTEKTHVERVIHHKEFGKVIIRQKSRKYEDLGFTTRSYVSREEFEADEKERGR